MAIIVSQIETPLKASHEEIIKITIKKLGIYKSDVVNAQIHKTSLDARKQNNIKFVSSVYLELKDRQLQNKLCYKHNNCVPVEMSELEPKFGKEKYKGKIVIAGFGPAGMFAALTLAEYGYKPVVFERGDAIENRVKKVNDFWLNGKLDINSNVQFGEGGAGTFSDGKLTTRIKDPLCNHVLKKFIEFGAPTEIMTKAKPHIGTDNLRDIVKNIRNRIIELEGEVNFNSSINDLKILNNEIVSVYSNGNEIQTNNVILAIGHSARDTFEMLLNKNVFIEPKAFSVGARIEHTQEFVNRSLYGKYYDNPLLPQGEYQLSYRKGNRGCYTFCMCPGGFVVPSASEENTVVTNGMSEFARNQPNANSALVVSVSPEDFGNNPLSGVEFARDIERKAFIKGGRNYQAPAVSVGSFLDKGSSIESTFVTPSYSLGVTPADFDEIFPSFVTDMMREGIRNFSRNIACFGNKGALLTGAETRTSSPVRITRGDNLQSINIKNIYPCGEGAGYAGGIMSAAVDGIKIALKIMENYSL